ncbi:MAG TPA: hypothetical protein VNZ86_12650, partial [Bacteroidia bacterium]|nr:hypothetical protein [Bacteroidia bacterium]
MKKSITLMITLGLGWTLHAQTGRESRLNEQPQLLQKTEAGFSSLGFTGMPAVIAEKSNHHSLPGTLSSGIKIRPLGQEPNALGTISNRQYLWADPSINTVSLAHRDTGRGSNSGFLYYDISKDMGKTWNNNKGPVYTPDASPQSVYFNARYPQSLIYNPAGNTKADSAYEVYFAPSLDNTNPSTSVTWGGHVYGVHQLSGLHAPTQHAIQSSAASDTWNYIPTSMFITKQGTVYNLDPNSPGTAGFDMNDSVILSKGTFNPASRDLNFTVSKVRIPEALTNKGKHMYYESKITFADDGMTGYISAIEKLDYASPDSSLGLVVYKTTDGGGTWAAPVKLDVNAADIFLLNAKGRYTTGFEHGAVVDGSGNLHLLVNVNLFDSAQRYSFYLLPPYIQKEIGLFDIYTKDGGITWYEKLITHPMTFGGIYGSGSNTSSQIFEFNRLHASRTYTGGKQLFFTWFDTDTTLSQRNIMPDMYSMGYDETTNKWTTVRNFTQGTAADGSVRQGMVSYYVFNNANSYTIPC